MKKIIFLSVAMLLFLTLVPAPLKAAADNLLPSKDLTESVESTDSELLLSRLTEIDELDKSNLSSAEKKDLRKEVRNIKNALEINGDGVYLSVGALILIVVLLILLL